MWCQIVVGPQFQNFMSKCCIFTWRRALDFFYCYPKLSNFFFFSIFKGGTRIKINLFFSFFKSKNWRETPQTCSFLLNRSKTTLTIFGNTKKD